MALLAGNTSLMDQQVARLLRMTALLRDDLVVLQTVCDMKACFDVDDIEGARQLFATLEDNEKQTLWIAPKYGGLFTTRQREMLRGNDEPA